MIVCHEILQRLCQIVATERKVLRLPSRKNRVVLIQQNHRGPLPYLQPVFK